MEICLKYKYYTDTFKGSLIPINSFEEFALRAGRKLNYFTFNRIKEWNNNLIKDTTCSIAELLYTQEQKRKKLLETNQKSSESVGPWNVSYKDNSQYISKEIMTDKELNHAIYDICKEHLFDTDLLYRGV